MQGFAGVVLFVANAGALRDGGKGVRKVIEDTGTYRDSLAGLWVSGEAHGSM